MIRSLHIARTGLDAQQTQLDVISNNLANVSTTGFKKGRAVFEDLLYQIIRQPGAQSTQQTQLPSGFQLGVGVRPVATERIFNQGSLQQTGNSLDVAISGRGFFQIQMPDGGTAYTRDGSFQVDNQGNLVTASGYAVLPNLQIPANALVSALRVMASSVSRSLALPIPSPSSGSSSLPPSSTMPACKARARTCSSKPPRPARRRSAIPARMVWACSTRVLSRLPTSMSPRNWST